MTNACSSGLIVNPRSGKQRGDGVALAAKLAGKPDVCIHVLDRFEDLVPALEDMARNSVNTLFISSGDGTVQQIQTELSERTLFKQLPQLCLVPHGTTNLTAADLGLGIKDHDEQARIISDQDHRTQRTNAKVRPTMRVANPADGLVRHGMFLGTGAIWRATVFCQEAVHKTGLRGDWATFATLAAAVGKVLVSRNDPASSEQISQAYPMIVETIDGQSFDGGQLLFLATTLDKLILNSRPFWGTKTHAVRASIFPYPPPSIPRWLWTSLYGSVDRKMPVGCHSFTSDLIKIDTRCPFVIDGEFFEPPIGEPLRIEKGTEFSYLCAS